MADINLVVLTGRLTRKPELKYTTQGRALATFHIAQNRRKKEGDNWVEDTIFINDITAWGKTAEIIQQYVDKGDQIIITGRLDIDEWETDGQKRRKMKITVTQFSFGAKKGQTGSGAGRSPSGPQKPPDEDHSRDEFDEGPSETPYDYDEEAPF